MSFSRKYQLETERKNDVVIKILQRQGDLPEDAPWEHISLKTGLPLLERFQCEIPGCGRLTWKLSNGQYGTLDLATVSCKKMCNKNETQSDDEEYQPPRDLDLI